MSLRPSGTGWRTLGALGLVWLTTADAEPPATVTSSALQACASLTADAERLACYDRLAGRKPAAAATAAPSSHAPEATAAAGATAAASSHAAAATPTPAAAPSSTSFGQYAAEHPHPAVANSLEAPVAAVGTGANGHTTISLAGGAVWELV